MLGAGGRATRACLASALALFIAGAPRDARAADPDGSELSRAHDAYARGAAAYAQGDYARAARELAAADTLVPDAVTLRAALEAATMADDAVLGTELMLRAKRAPVDAPLAHAVSVAEARFAHRTGRVVIHCDGCLGMIDGAPAEPGKPTVVGVGVHVVVMQDHGTPEERMLTVAADETKDVRPARPPPGAPPVTSPPTPPPVRNVTRAESTGASPVWFAAAGSVTALLVAGTIASWVDTANDHASWLSMGCDRVAASGCESLGSTGQGAQVRTLALGAATGAAALGTAALGVFGVRWHGQSERAVAVGIDGGAAWMRVAF